jgi:outer membrane immunogenic protein
MRGRSVTRVVDMQSFLKSSILISALALSASAFAADLPTRKTPAPPPVYAPAFSWGGVYIGAFAGGNWANFGVDSPTFAYVPPISKVNTNDLTVGGLAGYNWAFNSFVIGGEMEAGYDHKAGSTAVFFNGQDVVAVNGAAEGRLRGRLGYAWNNVLLFAAGGVTAQDIKLHATFLPNGFNQEITHWRTGFNVGGGVEWAFADHWTVRGEYIYDSFNNRNYDFASQVANGFPLLTSSTRESTARAALIYKF